MQDTLAQVFPAGEFDKFLNIINGNTLMYELIGNNFFSSMLHIVHEKDAEKLNVAVEDCLKGEENVEELVRIQNLKGEWVKYIIGLSMLDNGNIRVVLKDIKDRQEAEHLVKMAMDYDKSFLTLSECIMLCYNKKTKNFRLFWQNYEQIIEAFNMDIDEWMYKCITEKRVDLVDESVFRVFVNALKKAETKQTFKFHCNILTVNTHYESCRVTFEPRVIGGEDVVVGVWSVINDFTGDKVAGFVEGSYIDQLTQLLNKKAIVEYANRSMDEKKDIYLVILDVDNFKHINDGYGHLFGDRVLREAGDIIKKSIGTHGVAGRFGGDEFMIVLENIGNELEMRNYLRAIKMNINTICVAELNGNKITCSMGISHSFVDAKDYKELFQIADKALYIAKQKGKDRYVIYKKELHGNLLTQDEAEDLANIKEAFYSDKDLFLSNRMLEDSIINGIGILPELLEQVCKTLMLDRIAIFWGKDMKLLAINQSAMDNLKIESPDYVDDEKYKAMFVDDFAVIANTNTLEFQVPHMYESIKNMGIMSTMHHFLRDAQGNIAGVCVADEFKVTRGFPKIALQTFENLCRVINGVIIREEQKLNVEKKDEIVYGGEAYKLFRVLSESSDKEMFYVCDMKKNTIMWSKAAVKYFGFENAFMCPADIMCKKDLHPEDLPGYNQVFSEVVSHVEQTFELEYRKKNAQGEYVKVKNSGKFIYDSKGIPDAMAGFVEIL